MARNREPLSGLTGRTRVSEFGAGRVGDTWLVSLKIVGNIKNIQAMQQLNLLQKALFFKTVQ